MKKRLDNRFKFYEYTHSVECIEIPVGLIAHHLIEDNEKEIR